MKLHEILESRTNARLLYSEKYNRQRTVYVLYSIIFHPDTITLITDNLLKSDTTVTPYINADPRSQLWLIESIMGPARKLDTWVTFDASSDIMLSAFNAEEEAYLQKARPYFEQLMSVLHMSQMTLNHLYEIARREHMNDWIAIHKLGESDGTSSLS